jgi:hypothetical protein
VSSLNGGTITLRFEEIQFGKSLAVDASNLPLGLTIDGVALRLPCELFENSATDGGAIFVQVAGGGSTLRTALQVVDTQIYDDVAGASRTGLVIL